MNVAKDSLYQFVYANLCKYGMKNSYADIVANELVQTDMWGIYSHGTKNLYGYICKAIAGGVSFNEDPLLEKESASIAVFDAKNTLGFISSSMAMEKACDIAERTGIAIAFVKNSSHFGAAGCFVNIAARRGMFGCAMSNVDRKMGIPGAKGVVMGQNPLALAVPARRFPSIFLDISTSSASALKILSAKAAHQMIPKNWICDKEGRPTSDPSHYPEEGALLPMSGHKGYGIALFIEILTSIVTGSYTSMSGNVNSWCFDLDKPNNVSHSFLAINLGMLCKHDAFLDRIEEMCKALYAVPLSDDVGRIYVPGEKAWENYIRAEKDGIILPRDVYDELKKMSLMSGISLEVSLGGMK